MIPGISEKIVRVSHLEFSDLSRGHGTGFRVQMVHRRKRVLPPSQAAGSGQGLQRRLCAERDCDSRRDWLGARRPRPGCRFDHVSQASLWRGMLDSPDSSPPSLRLIIHWITRLQTYAGVHKTNSTFPSPYLLLGAGACLTIRCKAFIPSPHWVRPSAWGFSQMILGSIIEVRTSPALKKQGGCPASLRTGHSGWVTEPRRSFPSPRRRSSPRAMCHQNQARVRCAMCTFLYWSLLGPRDGQSGPRDDGWKPSAWTNGPLFFQYFRQFKGSQLEWPSLLIHSVPGTFAPSRLYKSYNHCPCARPAHVTVAESGPRVRLRLHVLQNSESRMFMLRVKTLVSARLLLTKLERGKMYTRSNMKARATSSVPHCRPRSKTVNRWKFRTQNRTHGARHILSSLNHYERITNILCNKKL